MDYDLLTTDIQNGQVTFDYNGTPYQIDIFSYEGELVYQYGNKWIHGAEDFLDKARIDHQRITTVFDRI